PKTESILDRPLEKVVSRLSIAAATRNLAILCVFASSWQGRAQSTTKTRRITKRDLANLAGLPGAEQLPEKDDLAEVVGVMVGHEQRFAQERMLGPCLRVLDPREEIPLRVLHDFLHRRQVAAKRTHAFVPGRVVRRSFGLRPVARGKVRRDMFGIAAELK